MNKNEDYKDSGVKWIGRIPKHWKVSKTIFLSTNLDGKRIPLNSEQRYDNKGDVPYWGSNGIIDYIDDYLFDEKLVLVGEDGSPFFEKDKPVSFVSEGKVWINNHTHVLRTKPNVTPEWLAASFNITDYKEYITGSTRDKLTQSDLKRIPHPLPPLEEQKIISRYLNKRTEWIDSLIGKIQKKIELLKEQRASLINQYVTKGLAPNVEMKDSGIEWIGQIPKHWKIKKFGYVSVIKTGNTPSKTQEELFFTEDDNGYPWVKPSDLDVGFDGVTTSETKLTLEGRQQSRVVPKNSVLLCCIGTSGKYSISNRDLSTNQQINSIIFNDNVVPRYGLFFMDVFGRDLLKRINSVTLSMISKGDLSQELIVVPPIKEQIEISKYLDDCVSRTKEIIDREYKKIELLKEYRQSLISSVVTGKVRVTEDMV